MSDNGGLAPSGTPSELSGVSDRTHPRPPVDPARLNPPASGSAWTNLGYWSAAADYPAAARALARRVGAAARLRRGDVVLDVACGYGDSLRLWLEEFHVAHVIGVEPDPAVVATIRTRLVEWGLQERVTVLAARAEDVSPAACSPRPTAVVSVDAAYHFASRHAWLQRVMQELPAGGRVGLADLAVTPRGARSRRLRAMAQVLDIPHENLTDAEAIEQLLDSEQVQLRWRESAGDAVLDGFVRHQRRGGLATTVTRTLIRHARRARLVDYQIIGAECRSPGLSFDVDSTRRSADASA